MVSERCIGSRKVIKAVIDITEIQYCGPLFLRFRIQPKIRKRIRIRSASMPKLSYGNKSRRQIYEFFLGTIFCKSYFQKTLFCKFVTKFSFGHLYERFCEKASHIRNVLQINFREIQMLIFAVDNKISQKMNLIFNGWWKNEKKM